jgi:peptidoglycan/xylan/chitin deacetylase (PgdA/CDA1 family)
MRSTEVYLNLHGIGTPGPQVPPEEIPYWLSTDQFQAVLDLVGRSGRRVRLTFDDGNASDLALATPLLKRAGLSARFFVLTDRLGADRYLSEADVLALKDEGMAVGSHGTAHVPWTGLSREALFEQVSGSLARLTDILAAPVREVAVPFGAYDRGVLDTLKACAVSRAYTSDKGTAESGAWLVPRNTLRADMDIPEIEDIVMNRVPVRRRVKAILRRLALRKYRR